MNMWSVDGCNYTSNIQTSNTITRQQNSRKIKRKRRVVVVIVVKTVGNVRLVNSEPPSSYTKYIWVIMMLLLWWWSTIYMPHHTGKVNGIKVNACESKLMAQIIKQWHGIRWSKGVDCLWYVYETIKTKTTSQNFPPLLLANRKRSLRWWTRVKKMAICYLSS